MVKICTFQCYSSRDGDGGGKYVEYSYHPSLPVSGGAFNQTLQPVNYAKFDQIYLAPIILGSEVGAKLSIPFIYPGPIH